MGQRRDGKGVKRKMIGGIARRGNQGKEGEKKGGKEGRKGMGRRRGIGSVG